MGSLQWWLHCASKGRFPIWPPKSRRAEIHPLPPSPRGRAMSVLELLTKAPVPPQQRPQTRRPFPEPAAAAPAPAFLPHGAASSPTQPSPPCVGPHRLGRGTRGNKPDRGGRSAAALWIGYACNAQDCRIRVLAVPGPGRSWTRRDRHRPKQARDRQAGPR